MVTFFLENFSDFLIGFSMTVFSTWLVSLCIMDMVKHCQSFENGNCQNDSLLPPFSDFEYLLNQSWQHCSELDLLTYLSILILYTKRRFFVSDEKWSRFLYRKYNRNQQGTGGKKNYYVRAWNRISRGHKNDNEFHSLSQSLNEEGFDLMPKWLPYWRVCIYRFVKWRENANLSL